MNKKSILYIAIILLLSVGVYVTVEHESNVEVEITQQSVEVKNSESNTVIKETSPKMEREVITPEYYDEQEAFELIKKIDDIADKYYKKGVHKTFEIEGQTYILKDHSKTLGFEIPRTSFDNEDIDDHGHNYAKFYYYLSRPHPSVATLEKFFQQASKEFDVPLPILHSIAKREKNWTMTSPTKDQGWGIMHLTDNHYSKTLLEASDLLSLPPEILKKDALHNIRGAAALLAKYNNYQHGNFTKYSDWKTSLKKITGLEDVNLEESQVKKYLNIIYEGSSSKTLWAEQITLKSHEDVYK